MLNRIQTNEVSNFIELNDQESEIYNGSGYAIAYVDNDKINKFVYLNSFEYQKEESQAKVEIENALQHGNAWFGMCSNYQFCEVSKITMDDVSLLPKILRLSVTESDFDVEEHK